jgi:phage host-nuclease inhibitor protein Gam
MTSKDDLAQLLKAKTEIRAQIRKRAHDQIRALDLEIYELEREIEREATNANDKPTRTQRPDQAA